MRRIRPAVDNSPLKSWDNICRKIIEYGILSLLIFSPLPAASVSEWSILVIQLTVLVMLAAYFMMREKPQINDLLSRSLKWPKNLFMSMFALIFIQLLPIPKFLIKIFSPSAYSFQQNYRPEFSDVKFLSLSLIPSHTLQQGLELITYFLLGFLIIKTVNKRGQIIRIFSVVVAVGIFEALYGMFELYNKNPRVLFYKKIHTLDSVTGTFINRNHLSGYLEMVLPLALGLIIARINLFSFTGLKWRKILFRIFERRVSANLFISIGIIIMSLGIIFSKSRSGTFLLIFIFILFLELTILYFGGEEGRKTWIKNFLKVVFLVIILISLYIGIGATLERFAFDDLLNESRPTYWANTINIFLKYPIFGTGLGTFSSLYPDWEVRGTLIRLYHAHNDYLEYLSELGLIGMIFLLGGILFMGIKSFRVWRERRHPEVKGLALGGIIAIICMLIHSITDFNLHIPANMLLFSVVLSLTLVTSFYKKSNRNVKSKEI